jgi:endogenous inhibitor of DNA gyrase (YacG/DUF329 family)
MKITCPLCKKIVEASISFETRPFCSPRCKKIDLANWLEGNYRLPRELLPEDLAVLSDDEREEVLARAMGGIVDRKLH